MEKMAWKGVALAAVALAATFAVSLSYIQISPLLAQTCTLVPLDKSSIWRPLYGSHASCRSPEFTVDQDYAQMCREDATSLSLDLSRLSSPTSCLRYVSDRCKWDIAQLRSIEFHLEMKDCSDVWACPLWMTPQHWRGPQRHSGEIDFVETCRGTPHLSFGDISPFYARWGNLTAQDFKFNCLATFHDNGTVEVILQSEKEVVRLPMLTGEFSYGEMTERNWKGNPAYFISDIWNGLRGDAGYDSCQRQTANSKCSFLLRNIEISSAQSPTLACRLLQKSLPVL